MKYMKYMKYTSGKKSCFILRSGCNGNLECDLGGHLRISEQIPWSLWIISESPLRTLRNGKCVKQQVWCDRMREQKNNVGVILSSVGSLCEGILLCVCVCVCVIGEHKQAFTQTLEVVRLQRVCGSCKCAR